MKRIPKHKEIGKKFRDLLRRKGFDSDYDFSKLSGLKKDYISKICNGYIGSPKADTLRKIAEAFSKKNNSSFEGELAEINNLFAEIPQKDSSDDQEESNSTPTPSPESQPEEKTVPTKKSDIKENNTEVLVDLVAEGLLSYLKKDFCQDFKNEGLKFAGKGDYRTAIEYYTQAILLNPNDAEAYNNRGVVYFEGLKNNQKAIADFTRAIELDPEFYLAHVNRGNLFYKMKDYSAALKDSTTAIKRNPNDPNLYYDLGVIYCLINDYKRALEQFDKAIFLCQTESKFYHKRGLTEYNLGYKESALKDLQEAIKLCLDNDFYYNNRGIIYRGLNCHKEALNDFTQALKINPDVADYHINRGNVLFLIGNWGEARQDYEAALKLFWEQGDRKNYEKIAKFLRKLQHSTFLSRERNRRNATTSD